LRKKTVLIRLRFDGPLPWRARQKKNGTISVVRSSRLHSCSSANANVTWSSPWIYKRRPAGRCSFGRSACTTRPLPISWTKLAPPLTRIIGHMMTSRQDASRVFPSQIIRNYDKQKRNWHRQGHRTIFVHSSTIGNTGTTYRTWFHGHVRSALLLGHPKLHTNPFDGLCQGLNLSPAV